MSVERRTKGGRTRYLVRWREEGRSRAPTFDRRKDALDFEAERRRREQLGAHPPAEPSSEPLREWLETWWKRQAHGWARSTRMVRGAVMDKWMSRGSATSPCATSARTACRTGAGRSAWPAARPAR